MKKSICILNVNDSLGLKFGGGAAERTFQMSRALANHGIECDVLTIDSEDLNQLRLIEIMPANVVKLKCRSRRFNLPILNFRLIYKLVKKADGVHLMGHWSILNAVVYLFSRFLKKPYVVCPAGALPIYGRSKIIKRIYNLIIGHSLIRNASSLISITNDEICQFKKYRVDPSKITVIPNGINKKDFPRLKISNYKDTYSFIGSPVILFMGRLNSIKGPDILLEAFLKIRSSILNCHLVFAGPDGGLMDDLKDKVCRYNLKDSVHFLGYIGGINKVAIYQIADILVVPSRHEAMSIVALEAGVCGTAVLVTDQCGFSEIKDVDYRLEVLADSISISNAVQDLLKDKDSLSEIGRKMQSFVNERYTWDSLVEKYKTLYEKIIIDFKH